MRRDLQSGSTNAFAKHQESDVLFGRYVGLLLEAAALRKKQNPADLARSAISTANLREWPADPPASSSPITPRHPLGSSRNVTIWTLV